MNSYPKIFIAAILCFKYGIAFSQLNFTQYVNPFIGTGGHGHTFPGATVPFGMVQLSPDTRIDGSWDGCGGYHYSDTVIYGFSHTHLSGTGCSDYGDIMLMPMQSEPSFDNKLYSSRFSHTYEIASAGFYSVKLLDENINVELTSTARTGFHKYTFSKDGDVSVILDLTHRDKLTDGSVKIIDDKTIQVYRQSNAWAKDQRVYAYIVFSKSFYNSKVVENAKAFFRFNVKKDEPLYAKVSLSAVDEEGAKKNMEAELPGWNFEGAKVDAEDLWNKELSKIEVKDNDKEKLVVFYTALYHCFVQPNIYNDVDGRYRGRDMEIHTDSSDYYTVFSLWDTFRAWHPLMTIIDEKRTLAFIKTFINQYEQGGLLPVWELSSNETECMIGYHSVSVIADAMVKGINGFDYDSAYAACKKSADSRNRFGLGKYIDKGFLETDDENESVSKTLEYAYDDWCIAQMARQLGHIEDYNRYIKRAQSWRNMLDVETGFMRARTNGGWQKPFDPYEVNNNYTEANSFQYSFFTPHATQDIIGYAFGERGYEAKLDELFNTSGKTTGREQSDITGLIGQYAHGNEPSHHMAYLYTYINKPEKAQKLIHKIVNDFYKNSPDGLIGNEDCGQMSAWLVLSAIGFYSVCPGSPYYIIGTPAFEQVKIHTENGNTFQVNSQKESNESFYIQKIYEGTDINFSRNYFTQQQIKKGGLYTFLLGNNPVISQRELPPAEGIFPDDLENYVIPVPVINGQSQVFKDSMLVSIETDKTKSYKARYNINNADQDKTEPLSFYIKSNTTINAQTVDPYSASERVSKPSIAMFYKMPHKWSIKLNSTYSNQYTGGGADALIDGLHGDENWRKGRWQGYEGKDFECIIDLKDAVAIKEMSATFLQDTGPWIFMPSKVEFYLSADGKEYSLNATTVNNIPDTASVAQVKKFTATSAAFAKARFVKVKAYNYGKLPSWHIGAGGVAWLFIDEIEIK